MRVQQIDQRLLPASRLGGRLRHGRCRDGCQQLLQPFRIQRAVGPGLLGPVPDGREVRAIAFLAPDHLPGIEGRVLEAGIEDQHDLVTRLIADLETVLQRADEADLGDLRAQLLLQLPGQRLRAGLTELDATPQRPQVGSVAVRIVPPRHQDLALMPEHTDGHWPDDLRCHDDSFSDDDGRGTGRDWTLKIIPYFSDKARHDQSSR